MGGLAAADSGYDCAVFDESARREPRFAPDPSSQTEQAAKPDPFAPPNLYEYPKAVPAPFVIPKHVFDTIPQPIATDLKPYCESSGGPAQDALPGAQNEIRVYTNEVIAPVMVMDKRGQLVLDLEQKDFHIFDNGVEQKIVHWDLGGDPLAVALVIETSSHIEILAPVIRGMPNGVTTPASGANSRAGTLEKPSTSE